MSHAFLSLLPRRLRHLRAAARSPRPARLWGHGGRDRRLWRGSTDFRSVRGRDHWSRLGLAFLGEIIEWWLGFRFARTYGGSRRSAWGALSAGSSAPRWVVPVPIVGSVIGAFLVRSPAPQWFEYSLSHTPGTAVRVGWGAVVGSRDRRAAKIALGVVIAILGLFAALRG